MKNEAWPTFSFTDLLRPPEGWRTEHAILTTYSADLAVIVTALLALTGCDLDHRRTGSRVELVKAIETLRGRTRILAQANRVAVPRTPRAILKLLDRFLQPVETNENECSWHPKVSLVRYQRIGKDTDRLWRLWLGSRNLTHAMNWDAGLVLTSRADGRGQSIDGLASLGAALVARASLASFSAADVGKELAALTWDCPPTCDVQTVSLYGPALAKGLPTPSSDTERVVVISPFLDSATARAIAQWGNSKTRRTLVSTALELQRLWQEDPGLFTNAAASFCVLPYPELEVEGTDLVGEETTGAIEPAEGEIVDFTGLHAKLFFTSKGARRQLWIGSANATERGWAGRNYEVVANLHIGRDVAQAIEEFAAEGESFKPNPVPSAINKEEQAVEQARKLLSGAWSLRQHARENEIEVIASTLLPLTNSAVTLEIAALGGSYQVWPHDANRLVLPGLRFSQRSNFLQVRLSCGDSKCEWLQIAPCDPPPDMDRDRALIAQYLDPRSFLLWLRSVLADAPPQGGAGDWDEDDAKKGGAGHQDQSVSNDGLLPTVEEVLRAWARDASAFASADEKVKSYLSGLQLRAVELANTKDVELLKTFQRTWDTLASELR